MKRDGPPACLAQPRRDLGRALGVARRWCALIVLMWRLRLMYFLGARPEALGPPSTANEP